MRLKNEEIKFKCVSQCQISQSPPQLSKGYENFAATPLETGCVQQVKRVQSTNLTICKWTMALEDAER